MDFLHTLLVLTIFLPLVMLWTFALVDVFRRDDMGGFSKALWVFVIIVVPYFGTLIYLISRPAGVTPEERAALDTASRDFVAKYSPASRADDLKVIADLHDRGKLSDTEFSDEKARLLASVRTPATA